MSSSRARRSPLSPSRAEPVLARGLPAPARRAVLVSVPGVSPRKVGAGRALPPHGLRRRVVCREPSGRRSRRKRPAVQVLLQAGTRRSAARAGREHLRGPSEPLPLARCPAEETRAPLRQRPARPQHVLLLQPSSALAGGAAAVSPQRWSGHARPAKLLRPTVHPHGPR